MFWRSPFFIFPADTCDGLASATAALMTSTSLLGNSTSRWLCISSAVSTAITLTPANSVSSLAVNCELAIINVTSAPRLSAATATAAPCLPLERLPIYLTGSIGSRVPPAVTNTFLPNKSFLIPKTVSNLSMMERVSGNRPGPMSSPVNLPTSGSITSKPRALNVATLACVAGSSHICGCIAGTTKIGTSTAKIKFVNKSSARPAAMRAIKSAVAGAMITLCAFFAIETCLTSSTRSQT